jgi:hypothetical protein
MGGQRSPPVAVKNNVEGKPLNSVATSHAQNRSRAEYSVRMNALKRVRGSPALGHAERASVTSGAVQFPAWVREMLLSNTSSSVALARVPAPINCSSKKRALK